MRAASALLALGLVAGCATTPPDESELADYLLWHKRGHTVGELIYVYCERASPRERTIMATAIERAAYPTLVRITCLRYLPPPGTRPPPSPREESPTTPTPR